MIIVFSMIVYGCNSSASESKAKIKEKEIFNLIAPGADIYKARGLLLQKNFYVSEVVDATGRGENLTMTVDLKDAEFSDIFGYVTGVDLKPWKKGEKSHLLITSDMTGVIKQVEVR